MEKTTLSPFQLSRIYAQGWNTARQHSLDPPNSIDLNPYDREPERSCWRSGFASAIGESSTANPTYHRPRMLQ
jgi:hypothetical protein